MTMIAFRFGALAAGLLALSACVNKTTEFHSPDGRQTGVCSASGFGLIRSHLAANQYANCKNMYLEHGFVEGRTD